MVYYVYFYLNCHILLNQKVEIETILNIVGKRQNKTSFGHMVLVYCHTQARYWYVYFSGLLLNILHQCGPSDYKYRQRT